MDDKRKIKKICLIIILVIFAFILIENIIRAIAGGVENFIEKREEEKKQEQIYNTDEAKEERQVEEFVEVVFEALRDKDYEYIFSSLDETYRAYKFENKKENMISFINQNVMVTGNEEILKTEDKSGLHQVLISTMSGEDVSSQYFTIKVENENSCKLIFGEYTRIAEKSFTASTSKVGYEVKYMCLTPTVEIYAIQVTNKTTENLNIDINKASLVMANGKEKQGVKPSTISLGANETKMIEVYFGLTNSDRFQINLIGKENLEDFNVKLYFDEHMT